MSGQQHQAPRGTYDVLPDQQPYWRFVESSLSARAQRYGYGRIDTPVFEDADVFLRTVGDETDIVEKEMYLFEDRGGQQLALRPEGTAAVCRAYIEHGLHNQPLPLRLFYYAPMFRYDRPQAGRYRQLQQFGVEAIGDSDAALDLEVIELAMRTIEGLGLGSMRLLINSIGDQADRPAYLDALREHLRPHLDELGADDRRRFEGNPLRLLDSKDPRIQPLLPGAPRSVDYLGVGAAAHWRELLCHLDAAGIPYEIDHRLVRGLDYYTRTVFEVRPDVEGSQSSVCAGGRYDGLIERLGGAPTPAIGWAAGIDRLVLNMQRQGVAAPGLPASPVVVVYHGDAAKAGGIALARNLRAAGAITTLAPERSMRGQLRYASGIGAAHVIIIGEQELAKGTVTLRDMQAGDQREMTAGEAVALLGSELSG
jgi:histidyl-tRNA synthetase